MNAIQKETLLHSTTFSVREVNGLISSLQQTTEQSAADSQTLRDNSESSLQQLQQSLEATDEVSASSERLRDCAAVLRSTSDLTLREALRIADALQLADEQLISLSPPELERRLHIILHKHTHIEAIWINDEEGGFLVSIPKAGLLNAKHRPWYKNAMQGSSVISDPFISAITKRTCQTYAVPIYGA